MANTILIAALGLAIVVIVGLVYFYSPFALGGQGISLKLGPGNCLDEASCGKYCEENLQDCIGWCGKNEHALCGKIAGKYFGTATQPQGGKSAGTQTVGPGGCTNVEDCAIYCQANLQECQGWCEKNKHELCELLTEYSSGN